MFVCGYEKSYDKEILHCIYILLHIHANKYVSFEIYQKIYYLFLNDDSCFVEKKYSLSQIGRIFFWTSLKIKHMKSVMTTAAQKCYDFFFIQCCQEDSDISYLIRKNYAKQSLIHCMQQECIWHHFFHVGQKWHRFMPPP